MNRQILGGCLRPTITACLAALGLSTATSAHGALLGVVKGWPDINQAATDISNVFVNTDSSHVWKMTINGSAASNLVSQNVQWFQGDSNHTVCPTNTLNSACSATPYTLTAYFDALGNFTTGSISIDGYIDGDGTVAGYQPDTTHGLANSGSILDATLTQMGFSSNVGTSAYDILQLDFRFTLDSTSSDWNLLYAGGGGGVLWNGRVQTGEPYEEGYGERTWVQTDFASAFSCSGASGCGPAAMDTFVPLPAAAWLFGSGLVGLFGAAARTRRARTA